MQTLFFFHFYVLMEGKGGGSDYVALLLHVTLTLVTS